MQLTSVTLSTTYLILDENMNPAVGVTKILNNLQECIDIIEEINKRNNVVLPNLGDISYYVNLKQQILDTLSNGKLDKLERLAELSAITENIEKDKDRFSEIIKEYLTRQKEIIKEFDSSLDNSNKRIKHIKGQNRLSWFKGWEKNQYQSSVFKGIVTSYANWEYPVMEIFPGIGDMLPHALSGEPLYVVDWDEALLEDVSKQFNEYYATKRLMKYTIDEFDLSTLPQNSFGFIYSVNYLNFENLSNLLDLAKNVYSCLLPGGRYAFIYNNSDDWWSVANAAELYFGLVDTTELVQGLKKIGFEIEQVVRSVDLNISYMIVKKPGNIEYIKNSSVLAKIIDKPNDLM